ncbi:MAG: hypothetical protein Q8R28_04060, partial [Dehalococcoidia bacterium]|nr:hypothetical protein [Dehalococcoidia bacterium]
DLSSTTLKPGQSADLTLHWGERPPGQDTRVGLKGHTGQVWAQSLATGDSTGDARDSKQVTQLNLPLDVPPGMYRITLDVLDSGKPLPLQQESLARPIFPGKSLLLGPVLVTRGQAGAQVPVSAVSVRQEVDLEKRVALLGYSLEWKDRSLDLTTYWKVLSIFREDYAVFAHLVDLSDKALTKNDLQPWASPYPSTLWQPGDLVSIPFHFDLPAGFTPQDHRVNVGMYTPDNFQRLSILDPAGNPITNTIYLSLTPESGTPPK